MASDRERYNRWISKPGNREKVNAKAKERARAYRATERGLEAARAACRKHAGLPKATRPLPKLCECCQQRPATHLDHDHETGKFRGWLCNYCNRGIGMLGDNVYGIMRAMNYLTRIYDPTTGRDINDR
jgi:hypothetical protein